MHQVVIVAVTAVVGLAALVNAAEVSPEPGAESANAATVGVEGGETAQVRAYAVASAEPAAEAQPFVRMCVGPARLSLGGAPFTRIAFGGDGCGRASLGLVGLKFLGLDAAPELPAGLPTFIEVEETEDAAGPAFSVPV